MYARVATFESDPSKVDDAIATVRSAVEGETPPGLEGSKSSCWSIASRARGSGLTLFREPGSDAAGPCGARRDEPGSTERRVSVEFFEVPVQTVTDGSLAT